MMITGTKHVKFGAEEITYINIMHNTNMAAKLHNLLRYISQI